MGSFFDETSTRYTLRLREMQNELPDFMREFFRGVADTTTARTRMGYAYDMNIFFEFLTREVKGFDKTVRELVLGDIEKVTRDDLEEFMSYLDYYISGDEESSLIYQNHAVGKSRKLSAIRSVYRHFQRKGKLGSNPAEIIEYPKIKEKGITRLEYNEVAKLLDIIESGNGLTEHQKHYHEYTKVRDLAMITLMLGTGIRVSECAGIDINHIDFENGSIRITRKGGNETIVFFGDEVELALNAYLDLREELHAKPGHENAVFLSLQKKRLDVRSIQNSVKKYSKLVTAFKNITPHKLRSTFGTNLYRETKDIYLVADVLGHKSVETTRKHYADTDKDRRKAARSIKLRKED